MKKAIRKVLFAKALFDKGWGIMTYPKLLVYVLAGIGIIDGWDRNILISVAISFGILCFAIGFVWWKYGLFDIENDIQNDLNPFQREVRKHLRKGKSF